MDYIEKFMPANIYKEIILNIDEINETFNCAQIIINGLLIIKYCDNIF